MSALMAERRDWAEDPRQASLFDALTPPAERPARAGDSDTTVSGEAGRVVEFPRRRDVPAASDVAPEGSNVVADRPAAVADDAAAATARPGAAETAQSRAVAD